MLERVWRKGNLLILLVRTQVGGATMGNNMEVPKKLKIELPHDPAITLLSKYLEETLV